MTAVTVLPARSRSLSTELRSATRADHARAEADLGLPDRLVAVDDLAGLLLGWSAIWSDVRSGSVSTPAGDGRGCGDEAARLLVTAVRAERQITADLRALARLGAAETGTGTGTDRSASDELRQILATPPGVWAVSYVLRGSRVGGTVLAPLVARRLGLPEGVADEYLGDGDAGRAWVAFRGRLDRWGHTAGPTATDTVVRLAGTVFGLVRTRLTSGGAGERR